MEDIDINFSFTNVEPVETEQEEQDTENVSWWLKYWYNKVSYDLTLRTIEPDSRLFVISTILIMFAWFYNLFYVPFAVAFEYEIYAGWYFLDIIAVLIYNLDILINLYTARLSKIETLVLDLNKIQKLYIDSTLLLDILSAIPIEYFILLSSIRFGRYILLHRIIFKVPRMV